MTNKFLSNYFWKDVQASTANKEQYSLSENEESESSEFVEEAASKKNLNVINYEEDEDSTNLQINYNDFESTDDSKDESSLETFTMTKKKKKHEHSYSDESDISDGDDSDGIQDDSEADEIYVPSLTVTLTTRQKTYETNSIETTKLEQKERLENELRRKKKKQEMEDKEREEVISQLLSTSMSSWGKDDDEEEEEVDVKKKRGRRKKTSQYHLQQQHLEQQQQRLQQQIFNDENQDQGRKSRSFLSLQSRPTYSLDVEHRIHYAQKGTSLYIKDKKKIPEIMKEQKFKGYPSLPSKCSIENCQKLKQYAHSKTGAPVCSLACYKILDAKLQLK